MAESKSKTETEPAANKSETDGVAAKPADPKVSQAVAEAVQADKSPEANVEVVKKAVAEDAKATTKVRKTSASNAAGSSKPSTQKRTAPKTSAKKTAGKEAEPKKTVVKRTTAKKPAVKKAVARKAPATSTKTPAQTPSIKKLKETIMATTTKSTKNPAQDVAADMQDRMQSAYEKAGEFASEAGEFSKANVEAMVESSKIFFSGAQELVRDNVETGKTVVETMTEDAKKVASAKSPTEFMQLQNEMARRNFDAMIHYGSERTEAWVKLYNEAFAPLSNRASVAAEKMAKVA